MISNFFNPKSIAIIGASDHSEKVGGILMKKALRSKAEIIPVNPSHDLLFNLKCYKKIQDYKNKIDLAVIAIPKDYVCEAIEDCGKKGIKNIIIISAGFTEVGDLESEKKIIEVSKKYNIRFIGSNCFGICNPQENLDLTFSIITPKSGAVAFISQSGALWSSVSDISIGKFGFSSFVSLGNMADLEFSDFIEYFSNDKNTKAIVLYIERLKDGKEFIEVSKKCRKPIFVVKAGSSKQGGKAAFSHTGSIATDYDIYKGAFRQAKVNLCSSILGAFEKASGKKILEKKSSAKKINLKKNVDIVTNGGGPAAIFSDYLAEKGIKVELVQDVIGTALAEDYKKALENLENDKIKKDNSIIVILTPQSMSEIEKTAQIISDFKKQTKKELVAVFFGGESMKSANKIFEDNKVHFFNTLEEARDAII